MFLQSIASGLLLAGLAAAQAATPPGFSPEVKERLDVVFGTKVVTVPGTSLAKAETGKQPTIGTSDVALNGTYVWLLIDQDVPSNFQNPSAGARRTNLHALISGFKATGQTVNGVFTLASSSTGPITYTGPAPPAENPPYAHRYVSLLYETTSTFTVSRTQVGQTFGFNLATFVTAAALGKPIRGSYFNVTG
ncbi:phosphatidylethanolamine-binding protein [Lasiosphaeria hispida]|uniref:Phosphatidylethanolamine-binding protein n=1 Tax=Lasiosphaeria hispida TaxID=260671 RepID=A0AAJ0HQR8_9PEZI|nr:phosphatidylethanolamine-binding protein [Lasiosphaeria hispida]